MGSAFLAHVREIIRGKYYSIKTEKTYVYWIVAFIRFYNNSHPESLGEVHIRRFLTQCAQKAPKRVDARRGETSV